MTNPYHISMTENSYHDIIPSKLFDVNTYQCFLKYATPNELERDIVTNSTIIQMSDDMSEDMKHQIRNHIYNKAFNFIKDFSPNVEYLK